MKTKKEMKGYLSCTKQVLSNMNFDVQLLNKEYRKSLKLLTGGEITLLHGWIRSQRMAIQMQPVIVGR
jgi:hypothetical protein